MRLVYGGCATLLLLAGASCGPPDPNGLMVELAPEVISSIDGTTTVRVTVEGDTTLLDGQPVSVAVAYTDRNGADHAIDSVEGKTDIRGSFETTFSGLTWEGTGTVTATVLDGVGGQPFMIDGAPVDGTATFSVLDRTPPAVEILPPTTDNHIGPGLPLVVEVHVTDEIGVSSVYLEAAGELNTQRTTVVASGSTDSTVSFRLDIPTDALPGPTITLYALASDLSNNQAAAEPIVLTVDPAITIATPPGLTGTQVSEGNDQFLAAPTAIARSPKDGQLYVSDNSQNGNCQGGCIWKVDPTSGAVPTNVVTTVQGTAEGVAFDATGDHLYYSDRQNRIGRLTWNGTDAYTTPTVCNNPNSQRPQDPFHLTVGSNGTVYMVDDNNGRVLAATSCTGADPTTLSNGQQLDRPRGIAVGPAGEVYVSDNNVGAIYVVDPGTGDTSLFEAIGLNRPYGLDWLAGGTSAYADSLLVAETGDRMVSSTSGEGARPVVYLRTGPVDVFVDGLGIYVLTGNNQGNSRGRIYHVTGF